jgi:hypothetical protein
MSNKLVATAKIDLLRRNIVDSAAVSAVAGGPLIALATDVAQKAYYPTTDSRTQINEHHNDKRWHGNIL